ncbi:aminopeptidase P family protein [Hwanghaeella grinnelliae]|uniref:Aminopeptidase P family protein n=1 Tax=Hwanghaeella grinnelliae TaxID=2500179 RepID=A0A3S2W2R8_9PROT|nr:aminopeptidase P family protein [Hwanghaeella grinnelliae]RVU34626.1 aminopeptidase P family protein [Hwanghaeella grinnelliae]
MTVSEAVNLLRESGVDIHDADLTSFLKGVVAGPRQLDTAWMDLLGGGLSPAARDALDQCRAELEQSLDTGLGPGPAPAERLDQLRKELAERGLDGLVIPRTDEFQGEYIPARADRLEWLTGFNGSAGAAVVGQTKAAIFVDGRYTLQVEDQVDTERFTVRHLVSEPVPDYLEQVFGPDQKIGFDPWLHTRNGLLGLQRAAKKAGFTLVPLDDNPIDAVWKTQPAAPLTPVRPHDMAYAGEASASKRERLSEVLKKDGLKAAVITASDSIAWLLNVRGGDVSRCPLPLSFAILHDDSTVDWFIDDRKLLPGLTDHLGNGVAVRPFDDFANALAGLGADGAAVRADPATAASVVFDKLLEGGAKVVEDSDPCLLPKACKNDVELAGTRAAHGRDGAAVTRFLSWLPAAVEAGGVTELSAADQLQAFRFRDPLIRDLSFDTISGAGPDGAIVHYRVTEETDRPLRPGELYLVDSGGQYLDGTTDITRTIAIGEPTAEMKDRFTRVLKGHIAIATARFPAGVNGGQLDGFARQFLWSVGLDFDHGTGHGVGSYLNVHEGPQRISKGVGGVSLQPGMILSNEPGFYKTGEYGIRIENLVVVTELEGQGLGEKPLLGFETITFAPIDLNLVEVSLMTESERAWLNDYHAEVRRKVAPQLMDDAKAVAWLENATRPI